MALNASVVPVKKELWPGGNAEEVEAEMQEEADVTCLEAAVDDKAPRGECLDLF